MQAQLRFAVTKVSFQIKMLKEYRRGIPPSAGKADIAALHNKSIALRRDTSFLPNPNVEKKPSRDPACSGIT